MTTPTKDELLGLIQNLDNLEREDRQRAVAQIANYVRFILTPALAGPISYPGGGGGSTTPTSTHTTFDCPSCGYTISATFK